jgi:hypothetical protein
MKRSKTTIMVATGLCCLAIVSTATAQVNPLDTLTFKLKSPGRARALSVTSTLGPVAGGILWAFKSSQKDKTGPAALFFSGAIIGPSVGYFYGGCNRRGARGMLIRLGIGTVTALFVIPQTRSDISSTDGQSPVLLLMVGTFSTITILTHAVADIMDVKYYVRKNNYEIIRRAGCEISLVPSYFPESEAPGLQLNVTF